MAGWTQARGCSNMHGAANTQGPAMNTIYSAKKIITMNPARPQVTHVAVRDGRIISAGSLE
ncbi:MAG: hypothetical protein AAF404_16710, partial [Pseudomonadota bacterium]